MRALFLQSVYYRLLFQKICHTYILIASCTIFKISWQAKKWKRVQYWLTSSLLNSLSKKVSYVLVLFSPKFGTLFKVFYSILFYLLWAITHLEDWPRPRWTRIHWRVTQPLVSKREQQTCLKYIEVKAKLHKLKKNKLALARIH